MRLKISYIILQLISLSVFGQDNSKAFYRKVHQAEVLYNRGDLDSSILTYELAFSEINYVNSSYIYNILSLSKISKDKKRIKLYKQILDDKKSCPNKTLLNQVDSLFKVDQLTRSNKFYKAFKFYKECNNDTLCDKTSRKYIRSKFLYEYSESVDTTNIIFLLKLLDGAGGYRGEAMLGTKYFQRINVLFLHFDKDTNNIILKPYLDYSLQNGYLTPVYYALIIDRHLYNTSGTQKYWTWPLINSNPKLSVIQLDEIDEFREDIGIFDSKLSVINFGKQWIVKNEYFTIGAYENR